MLEFGKQWSEEQDCLAFSLVTLYLSVNHSVLSDSLRTHGLQPARLLCPWNFSGQEYWNGLPFPSPGESSQPRDWTCISCIGRLVLYHWATREALGKFGFSCKPEVLTFLLKLMTISYFLHWSSRSLLITTISFNFYFIYISWPGLFFPSRVLYSFMFFSYVITYILIEAT